MFPLLSGVRVLEMTIAWAGPLAGRMMADLGADVILVERQTARGAGMPAGHLPDGAEWNWGDLPGPATRSGVYPMADPGNHPWNRQAVFNKHNRNKRSLCIDLKSDEGREAFRQLARQADIVLDNFSPKTMRSLGIDYESLRPLNPGIICVSMPGFGGTGPMADHVSYGPILEAHSGMASITGEEDAPLKLGAAFPDAIGGLTAAFAIASALVERDRTGEGQYIDLSQLEAYCAMGGDALLYGSLLDDEVSSVSWNGEVFGVPHGCFPCSGDDEWIALAVERENQWQQLRSLLEDEGVLMPDSDHGPSDARREKHRLRDAIADWSSRKSRSEAFEILQARGISVYPAKSNGELLYDEHLAERGMFVEYYQEDVGVMQWPAFPVRLGDHSDLARYHSAPRLGQHNEEILRELCGQPEEEIRRFADSGIIAWSPAP